MKKFIVALPFDLTEEKIVSMLEDSGSSAHEYYMRAVLRWNVDSINAHNKWISKIESKRKKSLERFIESNKDKNLILIKLPKRFSTSLLIERYGIFNQYEKFNTDY